MGQQILRGLFQARWNDAVETALSVGAERPPEGVSSVEDELLVTTDEVLTRKPQKRRSWELHTAKVAPAQGHRYLSGVGDSFLQRLFLMLLILGLGRHRACLLLADGARWIRNSFAGYLSEASRVQMILDWYHSPPPTGHRAVETSAG